MDCDHPHAALIPTTAHVQGNGWLLCPDCGDLLPPDALPLEERALAQTQIEYVKLKLADWDGTMPPKKRNLGTYGDFARDLLTGLPTEPDPKWIEILDNPMRKASIGS